MADKIKGEVVILYVHDGTLYRPVACLESNTLETNKGVIESQTKCAPGVIEKQAGIFSYTITADAIAIDTTSVGGDTTKASHDYLLEVQMGTALVNWKISTGIVDLNYYGNGIIETLSNDAAAGDEFDKFSLTINGNGSIATIDPIVP